MKIGYAGSRLEIPTDEVSEDARSGLMARPTPWESVHDKQRYVKLEEKRPWAATDRAARLSGRRGRAFRRRSRASALSEAPTKSAPPLPVGVRAANALSTDCTVRCGNVDYSKFAKCERFRFRTPCTALAHPLDSQLRRARRGSRSKRNR